MNLSSSFRAVKSIITANSPVLLVGAAVAGVVTTGVLAAKAGYKARGILDEASDGEPETLDLKQKFELTWLCYAAPAVSGVSTIASVAGVHLIHNRRHAALAGLYAMTSTKLDDVREQAEELLGPKKTQQLNDALADKQVERANTDPSQEVTIVEGGSVLCYDEWAGRWFMGSLPILEKAVSDVNLLIAEAGDACLNDFYSSIGLASTEVGATHGWSGKKIEIRVGSTKTPDGGQPALAFTFLEEPKKNLGRR